MLKVQINFKHRLNEHLIIQDIFVPISDNRLDFLIIEAKQLVAKEPIKPLFNVFLGYVMLNPVKDGLLQ